MKISSIVGKDKLTLSFEVFPPKTDSDFEKVKEAAFGVAAIKPAYISVTYGAGGSTSGGVDIRPFPVHQKIQL